MPASPAITHPADRALSGGEAELDATAERILDAALADFERFGTKRTTLEDIARRARVGRMTLYRRFPTREALLEALTARELQRFLDDLSATVGRSSTPEERIADAFVFTVRYLREHALLEGLRTTEPETLLPQATTGAGPLIAAARAFLAQQVRQVPGRATVAPRDAELAAETVIRVMHSLMLTPDGVLDPDDERALRRYARRFIAPILTGAGAPR